MDIPRLLVEPIVRAALAEDLGRAGDITTDAIVPKDARVEAVIASRQSGVLGGLDAALMAFELLDPALTFDILCPDGTRLATGMNHQLKVWDLQTGKETLSFKAHATVLTSVAFSPDGKRLVSSSYDPTVSVWDATTGKNLLTFKGSSEGVSSAVFSPDGKRIASASAGRTVQIWDVEGKYLRFSLGRDIKGKILSVAFAPRKKEEDHKGVKLAAGSGRWSDFGAITLWDVRAQRRLWVTAPFLLE